MLQDSVPSAMLSSSRFLCTEEYKVPKEAPYSFGIHRHNKSARNTITGFFIAHHIPNVNCLCKISFSFCFLTSICPILVLQRPREAGNLIFHPFIYFYIYFFPTPLFLTYEVSSSSCDGPFCGFDDFCERESALPRAPVYSYQ